MKKSASARTGAATRPGTTSAKSSVATATPPAPAPAEVIITPPPPLTLPQSFTQRLAAVYEGRAQQQENLFEPLMEFNAARHSTVGTVSDQKARQLFSLSRKLGEEAAQVPRPRKPGDVEGYDRKVSILKEQSQQALNLFWQHVKANVPQCDGKDLTIGVCRNWEVVLCQEPEPDLDELAEHLGLPVGLARRIAADMIDCGGH